MWILRGLAVSAAVLCVACTVDVVGDPGPEDNPGGGGSGGGGGGSSEERPEGKLSNNGLSFSPEAVTGLPLDGLGTDAGQGLFEANSQAVEDLSSIPEGLEHLRYSALCALDQEQALAVETPQGTELYPGLYGLAREWGDGACEQGCQRWVTACLLAHTNQYDLTVPISLRGAHPGLSWDAAIADEYRLQEAAFYGNAFVGTSDGVFPTLYACFGRALIDFTDSDGELDADIDEDDDEYPMAYLRERICGVGECGFDDTGPCHFTVAEGSACAGDAGSDGFYGNCKGAWINEDTGPGEDPVYPEVITTYLIPKP